MTGVRPAFRLAFTLSLATLTPLVVASPAARAESPRRRAVIGWTTAKPPQPFVELEVGRVRTHALVDTGASDHVVARALVDHASLSTVSLRAQGVDHGAGSMPLRGLAHTAATIPGFGPLEPTLSTSRDGAAFAVAAVHPRFHELGLGAFVSPQRLVTAGHAIVVDLAHGELLEIPVAQLRATLEEVGPLSLFTGSAHTCIHGGGTQAGITWITDALVEGRPARLLVDTGAAFGDLFRESIIGRALTSREGTTATMVTAGQSLETARVDDLTVRVGEVQRSKLRWNLVESQGKPVCPYDGVLGIDVLRHCAIAFDGQTISGRCEALELGAKAARPPTLKKSAPRKKNGR